MTTEQIEQRLAKLEQTVAKIDEKLDQLIPSAAKRPGGRMPWASSPTTRFLTRWSSTVVSTASRCGRAMMKELTARWASFSRDSNEPGPMALAG